MDVAATEEQEWVVVTPNQGVPGFVHTVIDLRDLDYLIRVSAINAAGVGEPLQISESCRPKDINTLPEIEIDPEVGQYVTIRAGTQIKLFGTLHGRPTPSVKWERDGGLMNTTAVIESTSDATSLLIKESTRDDAGT